jgi:serine protease inhibitor
MSYRTTRPKDRDTNMYNLRDTHPHTNHRLTLDRINLERNDFFNRDTRHHHKSHADMGEITGEIIYDNTEQYDKGMPVRSQYTIKKPIHDSNTYVDFKIFDRDTEPPRHVDYFDPTLLSGTGGGVGFSDIATSMNKISNQLVPVTMCSDGCEKLGTHIFNDLVVSMKGKQCMMNLIGLYSIFGTLYISSAGITEIELKQYFDFPNKRDVVTGLMECIDEINRVSGMFNMKNLLIIGNDVPYNVHYYDNIRDLCLIYRANIKYPDKEAVRINKIIKQLMAYPMRTSLIGDNINNLQLMFLNLLVIRPIWDTAFTKTISSVFYGKTKVPMNYLYGVGKAMGYYEDNLVQLLEIKCFKQSMVMGIILAKDNTIFEFDDTKIKFMITHLKDTILDEIKIPIFKQDFKIRYTNILKSTGLESVFAKVISPELFPETVTLHDIVQNISVDITPAYAQKHEINRGYTTSRKFIAIVPFLYYFRLVNTNTILFTGVYC